MSRRMWDKNELINIAEEHSGGDVNSVNGETGDVVLTASDIKATNTQSVQANLERIDLEVEGLVDDVTDLDNGKLDASKQAVSDVGGLVIPTSAPTNEELVGIGTDGAQERVTIGNNLTLSNGVLSATGGGSGTLYAHAIQLFESSTSTSKRVYVGIITSKSTAYTMQEFAQLVNKFINSANTLPAYRCYDGNNWMGVFLSEVNTTNYTVDVRKLDNTFVFRGSHISDIVTAI